MPSLLKLTGTLCICWCALAHAGESADTLYEQGLGKLKASQSDHDQLVDAVRLLAEAAKLYDLDHNDTKAVEANSCLYWAKKKMTMQDMELLKLDKDQVVVTKLAVVSTPVKVSDVQVWMDRADDFAQRHPTESLLIAIRYFEVGDRFKSTDSGLKAIDLSLKYLQKVVDEKKEMAKPEVKKPALNVLPEVKEVFVDGARYWRTLNAKKLARDPKFVDRGKLKSDERKYGLPATVESWNTLTGIYFNCELPPEVQKAGLPVNWQNLILVHILGVDGVLDLKKKYGKDWYANVPKDVLDFLKIYEADPQKSNVFPEIKEAFIDGAKYRSIVFNKKLRIDPKFQVNRDKALADIKRFGFDGNEAWNKVTGYYFNYELPSEVMKTELPVNWQSLIIVHVLGVDGVNDLKKKYGKDWFNAVPKDIQDFMKLYDSTKDLSKFK